MLKRRRIIFNLTHQNKEIIRKIFINLFILAFFYVLTFIINKVPNNVFIGGGDFFNFIPDLNHIKNSLFSWSSEYFGQGINSNAYLTLPFSYLLYLLNIAGFSYSTICNFLFFLFLTGSFYSFFLAIKNIEKEISFSIRLLTSFIYSINILTFSILAGIYTGPTGVIPFYYIYVFVPLIFALFFKIIKEFSLINLLIFSVLFFISSISFENLAFFIGLILVEFIFLLVLLFASEKKYKLRFIRNFVIIFLAQIFLLSYYLIPYLISLFPNASNILSSNPGYGISGGYLNMIKGNSPSIIYPFTFTISKYFYPYQNLYSNLKNTNIFIAFTSLYIFILLIFLFLRKKGNENKWINFLIFYIFLFVLLMRFTKPFESMNYFIYRIPIFGVFRGPDKLFTFYPFFFLILLALILNYSHINKKLINFLLIFLLLIPFPFYIGGIPKYLGSNSNTFLSSSNNASYKYLIKIPDNYLKVKNILDNEKLDISVIDLPPSFHWQFYPEFDYYGVNFLAYFLDIRCVTSSNFDNPESMNTKSFDVYNKNGVIDIQKFLGLIQKFNGKYILIHKDLDKYVTPGSKIINQTIDKLEKDKVLKRLEDNENFTLFELDEKYLSPLISSDNKTKIYYKKISPVKYKVLISNLSEETNIGFYQTFDASWKVFENAEPDYDSYRKNWLYETANTVEHKSDFKIIESEDFTYLFKKPLFDETHSMIKDYANSWKVDPGYIKENLSPDSYKLNKDGSIDIELTIYYKSQIIFYIGLISIGLYFAILIFYIVFKKVKRHRRNNGTAKVI
jgi:hypothetical protein